jgi:adenine C2-methylase RlmN of 23S rRNA A2503 and tRNA A37
METISGLKNKEDMKMIIINKKQFGNGNVYALKTSSNKVVETTDTYLPFYTKNAVGRRENTLISSNYGSRTERWMIGISTMSGCPIGCKFCAAGGKFHGNLEAREMLEQVEFVLSLNPSYLPQNSKEFRILMTRMGEPALNYQEVSKAIELIKEKFQFAEIAISTIGIKNPALEQWLQLSERYPEIHLQFSVHSTSQDYRDWLIPAKNKLTFQEIREFGERWMQIKNNKRKISLNFTLVEGSEFSIEKIEKYFPKEHFFIKLSPVNENYYTRENKIKGAIQQKNLA